MSVQVVGIDPGFSHIGIATLDVSQASTCIELVDVCHLATQKSKEAKAGRSKLTDDDLRRFQEIGAFLSRYLDERPLVVGVVFETRTSPPNSSTYSKITACCAILAEVCRSRNIPIYQINAKVVKRVAAGNWRAEKEEIILAMADRFPDFDGWPTTLGELPHCADAAAVGYAGIEEGLVNLSPRVLSKRT